MDTQQAEAIVLGWYTSKVVPAGIELPLSWLVDLAARIAGAGGEQFFAKVETQVAEIEKPARRMRSPKPAARMDSGEPATYARGEQPKTCTQAGCGKKTLARGLCKGHYSTWRSRRLAAEKKGERATTDGAFDNPTSCSTIAEEQRKECPAVKRCTLIATRKGWPHFSCGDCQGTKRAFKGAA